MSDIPSNGRDETPRSRIVIEFSGPGSADFSFQADQVTTNQLLAVAGWLDWKARLTLNLAEQTKLIQAQVSAQDQAKILQVLGQKRN